MGRLGSETILPVSVHLTVTEMETWNRDGTCKWTLVLLPMLEFPEIETSFPVMEKEIFPQNSGKSRKF